MSDSMRLLNNGAGKRSLDSEIIGLVPAAGWANRIAPLPCSKELYPVGFRAGDGDTDIRPKVVSHYLLDKMRRGGISKVYFVLRTGKWDIPAYFGDGSCLDMRLAYLVVDSSWGVPCTLDCAYPFVQHATVAFAFPDILFDPPDAFAKLRAYQSEGRPDVVLGLCRKRPIPKCELVDVDDKGAVRDLIIGTLDDRFSYSWAAALWTPVFTRFLHNYTEQHNREAARLEEPSLGQAIRVSIKTGLRVEAVVISEEPYLDIGTPEGLVEATRRAAQSDSAANVER
jgi:glucose-1-phosphate thymidylyltransferase